MSTYRTSLAFARLPDAPLNTFGENVITRLTGNPGFTTPLVSMAVLTGAQTAFASAIVAAQQGGKQATATKNAAREALIALLQQEAAYVQSIAGEELPLLLSSGFENTNTNRTQVPLSKPLVDQVDNPMSGQLGLRLKPVYTARAYEVRMSYGTTGWQAVGVFTQSRVVIPDLTPGTTYTLQARAIGGSTGYSDWSDPVSHMAM
ncbi:MAG: fibronectin type III domain-containing protein [Verrucomicrobiota bacterium]